MLDFHEIHMQLYKDCFHMLYGSGK